MRWAFALAAACLAPAAPCAFAAEEASGSIGAGLHYSRGDYGTSTTTEITSLAFTGQYETGRWILKLTVPYIQISGSASVVPGIGSVGRGRGRGRAGTGGVSDSATSSESGLGDVVGSATYALYYDSASRLGLDATAKLKLPTADRDRGLGTGEADMSFQLDAYQGFDRVTAFAGVGYTLFGSSPSIELDDAFYYTLGASYRLDARDSAGLAYDERERLSAATAERRELMAFFTRAFGRGWKAQIYFLKGLADGSPDWGIGASAAHAF